ncbi:MAG: hypothetical protein ACOX0U_04675 [Oscillospiraceae bacterium]
MRHHGGDAVRLRSGSVSPKAYPNRFFDTGIAEGHAAAMAGGMAKQGLLPCVCRVLHVFAAVI